MKKHFALLAALPLFAVGTASAEHHDGQHDSAKFHQEEQGQGNHEPKGHDLQDHVSKEEKDLTNANRAEEETKIPVQEKVAGIMPGPRGGRG